MKSYVKRWVKHLTWAHWIRSRNVVLKEFSLKMCETFLLMKIIKIKIITIGSEFTRSNAMIEMLWSTKLSSLFTLWPGISIVHGWPRNPQAQGVERANGNVQNILGSWMRENRSTAWTTALPIIAYIKNRKYHTGNVWLLLIILIL